MYPESLSTVSKILEINSSTLERPLTNYSEFKMLQSGLSAKISLLL